MLAEHWPDADTHRLLKERAVEDKKYLTRSAALEALADNWPDDDTRRFLKERAVEDSAPGARGTAFYVLGSMHSEFGRIVTTKDMDRPYLHFDPLYPIPREHIEKAADRAGIPADQVDAELAELKEILGWDITEGAKPPEDET